MGRKPAHDTHKAITENPPKVAAPEIGARGHPKQVAALTPKWTGRDHPKSQGGPRPEICIGLLILPPYVPFGLRRPFPAPRSRGLNKYASSGRSRNG